MDTAFVITVVADGHLTDSLISEVAHQFDEDWTAGHIVGVEWFADKAAEFTFEPASHFSNSDCPILAEGISDLVANLAAVMDNNLNPDVIVQRRAHRHRKLLVADMDSTMITVECIDELADYAGLKAEVSAVTERAMRGEIDFAGALRDRVALLAGMKESVIDECLRERVKLMGGAKDLIAAFRQAGGEAILVSGGFTHFTGPVATEIGFDRAIANRLIVEDGVLTGEVETPIVDAQTKKNVLLEALKGRDPSVSIAIGDGANDIPMIEAAGLGVAYHAKPKTIAAADACVRFGDLNVVRYALGL